MITKYYISFNNSDWSQFWPSNSPVVKWEREGVEIFKRSKVDKFKITKTKNSTVYASLFTRFYDYTYFGTDIYYKVNIDGVDKFYFISPINYCKIDSQNGVFECTPEPNDLYRDILLQYERKWEMRTTSSALFSSTQQFWYPKKNTNSFVNVNFTTFTATTTTVSWTSDGSGAMTARVLLPVATISGDFIILSIQSFAGTALYVQLVNGAGTARSAEAFIDADGKFTLTQNADDTVYVQIKYPVAVASSGSFSYNVFYPAMKESGGLLETMLDYCINGAGITNYMDLSYNIVSTYLWNDALPTGHATKTPNISTYITAHSTNDYVIEAAAQWNLLWLAKVDVFTTDREALTQVSLKDIMDILKVKLRACWYIDTDGKIRIEHDKYFRDYSSQADLTSVTYTSDRPEVDAKETIFDASELVNQIRYKENNEKTLGFVAYPVIYQTKQTSSNTKDVMVEITTDIEYVSDNPANASNSGLVLMRGTLMGAKTFIDADDLTLAPGYGEIHPNAHLAWDYLIKNYFTYFNDAETGYINYGLVLTTFAHVKEFLRQQGIKFRMTGDYDPLRPFTTSFGTAWVNAIQYDLETGMYKADMMYNPYDL